MSIESYEEQMDFLLFLTKQLNDKKSFNNHHKFKIKYFRLYGIVHILYYH